MARLIHAALLIAWLAMSACGPDSSAAKKPRGTLADPVEVCERAADVCRLDESRLGVCMMAGSGTGFTCTPQH